MMLPRIFFVIFLSFGGLTSFGAESGTYFFDFGTAQSPVMEGFAQVTPQTLFEKEAAFGFESAQNLSAIDRGAPEPLSQDYIVSPQCTFIVKVPNGNYTIWILYGDSHVGSPVWPANLLKDQSLEINSEKVFNEAFDIKSFYKNQYFAHLNDEYQLGDKIWKKYLSAKFKSKSFHTVVTNGVVKIAMSNLPVNSIIIYEDSKSKEMEDEIQYLDKRRSRKVIVEEAENEEKNILPTLSEAQQKRCFVLFSRHWSERIFPNTVPKAEEVERGLSLAASLGENEPSSFALYPLENAGVVQCSCTDLKSKEGDVLSKENIELRTVRYLQTNVASRGSREYRIKTIPYVLENKKSLDLQKGLTRQIFINAHIPLNAKPGIYQGQLHIQGKPGVESNLEIQVRVLPFKLPEPPILYGLYHFGYDYYYYYYFNKSIVGEEMEKLVWENEEKDLKFLREHGFNSVSISDDMRGDIQFPDGKKISFNPDGRFSRWMDLYTRLGFREMPWYGFQPWAGMANNTTTKNSFSKLAGFKGSFFDADWKIAYKDLIGLVRDEGKKKKWPEILFYVSDELANYGVKGAERGVDLLKLSHEVKGIRTISSFNGPCEEIELPYTDIAMPNFAFPITEESVQKVKKANAKLWLYNVGFSRFSYGFYPWKLGAGGRYQWFHRWSSISPYNGFDGTGPDTAYMMTFPTPDGPLGTLRIEEARKGIDDRRVLALLETMIETHAGKADGELKMEIEKARALLTELKSEISVDIRDYMGAMDAKEAGVDGIKKWSGDLCDKWRWKIENQIMELQKKGAHV